MNRGPGGPRRPGGSGRPPKQPGTSGANGRPARPSFKPNPGVPGANDRPARPSFKPNPDAPGANGRPARPNFKPNPGAPDANGRPARPSFKPQSDAPGTNNRPIRPNFKSRPDAPGTNNRPARPSFQPRPDAPGANDQSARPNLQPRSDAPGANDRPARPSFKPNPSAPGANGRPPKPNYTPRPGVPSTNGRSEKPNFKPNPGANGRPARPADRSRPHTHGVKARPASPSPDGRAPAGKKPGKPTGPDARRIALDALLDVTASGAYSTLALDERLRSSRIDPLDKRLATSIFYTALENRLKLAHALRQFVERMPDRETGCILHIAAAQLLLMDKIPDYAAVDAAAQQARALDREAYVGLVNGSLRSLVRARDAGEIRWPDRSDPLNYLSIMHSLPAPLAARLIADYGLDEAERIIAYRPETRTETVRPNLTKMDGAAFAEYGLQHGWSMEKATVPNAWRLTRPGDLTGDPDYKMGLFSVQGEGSMLAALALEPKRAGNYLDACAAPGGKSALIAEMMQNTGRVQSWDVHEHRVELIQNTKKRLRLDNLRPAHRDASVPRDDLNAAFDGVLIDAPCSGLGVMHDKPDIKYRMTEEDLGSLADLQKRILDACAPYVAPGGLLVYATCTVLKDENERQVRAFLARHPEFEPETGTAFLPDALKPLMTDGMIQLQAYAWNAEGFFIARMRRVRP